MAEVCTVRGKFTLCEFGRSATVLLTCRGGTEARDTSENARPCNVSFVYLLGCFSPQDKIFSCVCHLTHGDLRLFGCYRVWIAINCERSQICNRKLPISEDLHRGRSTNHLLVGVSTLSGAPNENIVQNHLNIALFNVFQQLNLGRYRHIFVP